ncbi:MAG: cob(I)alamin adenolsyltransferase/cobinamide ATP-dependent adenolsyltransferase [Methanomassiliicoccales archaeon PtaU1.Bin124]|nr:MAG: cob(I)alamin adenolsyltransferase/cobinamide ATP-dependent adenolsyltransferase [Methanomassiliicoccales archaeon PtaU1.Bin124]
MMSLADVQSMGAELGLVQVYTGEGKGKTTAALGLALRAWGHGLRVCIIQFMKVGEDYGEVIALRKIEGIDIYQFGSDHLVFEGEQTDEDIALAERGLNLATEVLESNEYDVLILDEINVALYFGLLSVKNVLTMIKNRSGGMEVVLTGRHAPKEVLGIADLVTVMRAEKHPYDSGVVARKGIEF